MKTPDESTPPGVGDVYRHREDGDLCRVTDATPRLILEGAREHNLHDGSFGAPSLRELAERWERTHVGVSDEIFRAMSNS